MKSRCLTPRQERFVDEYLVDLNATQAAIRAGYSRRTHARSARKTCRNLTLRRLCQSARRNVPRAWRSR